MGGVAVVYLGEHVHLKTPAAIPEELIINGATELGPTLQPVASDPFLLDETLVILRKFSLVCRNASTNTLSMHRLVQAVLQDSMSEKTRRVWAERTVRAERFYLDALTIWQQMPKTQHPLMCTSLHGLAQLCIARGKYAQVEVYLHQERAHPSATRPR
jgi:hypothetical protein